MIIAKTSTIIAKKKPQFSQKHPPCKKSRNYRKNHRLPQTKASRNHKNESAHYFPWVDRRFSPSCFRTMRYSFLLGRNTNHMNRFSFWRSRSFSCWLTFLWPFLVVFWVHLSVWFILGVVLVEFEFARKDTRVMFCWLFLSFRGGMHNQQTRKERQYSVICLERGGVECLRLQRQLKVSLFVTVQMGNVKKENWHEILSTVQGDCGVLVEHVYDTHSFVIRRVVRGRRVS